MIAENRFCLGWNEIVTGGGNRDTLTESTLKWIKEVGSLLLFNPISFIFIYLFFNTE